MIHFRDTEHIVNGYMYVHEVVSVKKVKLKKLLTIKITAHFLF